ncbi:hypothetical protein MTo_02219 [Microcystis aeruginosa NIES-1211]|nr:hypothetical protein MTo_02219 [Microcystis aeruginosa NIES-1211]
MARYRARITDTKTEKIVILTKSNPFAIKILEKSIYLILSVTHLAI